MTKQGDPGMPSQWQQAFLATHQLDPGYLHMAHQWLDPLAAEIAAQQHQLSRTIIVGINGCQGSGKTTLSNYLCNALAKRHQCSALAVSLDDFYLTKQERTAAAAKIHPLLKTRGVPGTHDYALLRYTLETLSSPGAAVVPRFNKADDDRAPIEEWGSVATPIQVILLEGWCLGAVDQSPRVIKEPINRLEREADQQATWRCFSNTVLREEFLPLYSSIDIWAMFAAPSFDTVLAWRSEQERKLSASLQHQPATQHALMDEDSLEHFVSHFERITQHCLDYLPNRVNHFHQLDSNRNVVAYRYQPRASVNKQ